MLPSILPTSDIRSMFHFTRSGNVAALFFFDDSVLGRVRDAVLFNTAANDNNSSHTGGGKNTATTTTKRSRSRIDTPEGLIAARHLWPILQQQQDHDENSDAARKNNNNNPNKNPLAAPNALDDEEIELFLLVSDHIQISKVQARTRANSILTLRDRNRDSNAFSENYHTVSKVGGEEGMRLLLSTISPKNLHRFGIYGSLIESNQMISRFSDGRLAIGSSVVISSSSNTANSQQQRKIGPSESDVSNSSFVSASGIDNSSFPSTTSKTTEGTTEKSKQEQEQRSFFLGAYFEELRENAIEALGSDIFVHHVSAILRRVQYILSNSDTATKKSSSTTKTFTAAEQFDLPTGTLENAILNISNDQRFRAFSLFFECGFTFLLLGSSRLAVSYFTRSASIVSVLLRGAFPPSLLDRLRALLSLALAKFFAGFALQRCGYGPEAAQEFRRSRFALFDADAMCRAMMRSYTTGNKGDDDEENNEDSHEKSSSMFRSNNVNGINLMTNKSRYLSNEINDLENDEEHQRHYQKKKKKKTTSEERSDDSDEDDEESDTDEENNEDQERRGQSSKTAKVAQTLDDICGNEQGYNALMHVRHVIRSFIRHSMLHEGHAVSSTVISPLLFHVSSAVENAPVLGKPEDDQTNQNSFIERRKSLVEGAHSTDRNQQQQQQQVLLDNTSWPAKQQLEICLRSLKVLDEVKNATFDIANNDKKNTQNNRASSTTQHMSDADEEKFEKSGSGGHTAASSFITMRKKSEKKVTNSSGGASSSST